MPGRASAESALTRKRNDRHGLRWAPGRVAKSGSALKKELNMRVGVPKEIKNNEFRVGLTPASVAELTAAGTAVVVETYAGLGIEFSDESYVSAGTEIITPAREVFAAADLTVTEEERQGGKG